MLFSDSQTTVSNNYDYFFYALVSYARLSEGKKADVVNMLPSAEGRHYKHLQCSKILISINEFYTLPVLATFCCVNAAVAVTVPVVVLVVVAAVAAAMYTI